MNNILSSGRMILDKVASWGQFLPPLLTRAAMGYGFYATGKGKLAHLDRVGQWFDSLGIPFPEAHAWAIGHLEYYGGILLLVGVLTRLVSLLLAGTMVGALLTADKTEFLSSWTPQGESLPVDLAAFVYLVFLSWLIFHGPGRVSIDQLLWNSERLRFFSDRGGDSAH